MRSRSFCKVAFFTVCFVAACGGSSGSPSGGSPSAGSPSAGSPSGGSPSGGSSSGGPSTSSSSGGDAPVPGDDVTVAAFERIPVYFAGADDKRTVDTTASFPATGAYQKIVLHLSLSCPTDGCDPWDRIGSLGVVTQKAAQGSGEIDTVIELQRFITPYHVGATWDLDVTDLRPLLTGEITLRAFIDTSVGPGSPYGGGWLLSASFEMTGGVPSPLPVAVIPVWTMRSAVYGDPAKPIAESLPTATLAVPPASSYALRTFVTGHGQGNADNCAEFCARMHTVSVGSTPHETKVWRDDCRTTAVPAQQGTWQYSRAGWCPGADVVPWRVDVTADIATRSTATIAYDVESYENTCRPGASECKGCSLGTGCAYDDGSHTEPNYQVSSVLIAYR